MEISKPVASRPRSKLLTPLPYTVNAHYAPGKAAVDVLGAQVGKTGGSFLQQGVTLIPKP